MIAMILKPAIAGDVFRFVSALFRHSSYVLLAKNAKDARSPRLFYNRHT